MLHGEATSRSDSVRVEIRPEAKQTLSPFATLANVTKFIDGIIGKFGF